MFQLVIVNRYTAKIWLYQENTKTKSVFAYIAVPRFRWYYTPGIYSVPHGPSPKSVKRRSGGIVLKFGYNIGYLCPRCRG